ncbi:MAG TPA: sodium:proton antiporter [Lacipirellulaceae bacterium]
MDPTHPHRTNRSIVPLAIVAILAGYLGALFLGWPQQGTRRIVETQEHHPSAASDDDVAQPAASAESVVAPPVWAVIPFMLLLAAIAVLPLIPATMHWWDSNRNRFLIAAACALVTLAYYAFVHRAPLEGHWPAHHVVEPKDSGVQLGFVQTVFENAILSEFIPFIVLLFSLFAISGGIRITGDLEARPLTNAAFIGVGGILASFIGTTGAAMLLIRPVLETNRERKHVVHTIVFFIFVVCNCGGCLLPIGDPPLFLGYLQGVPFLWTLVLWKEWLFINALLLAIYVLLDRFWYYPRESAADIRRDVTQQRRLMFSGWQLNVPLLAGVVLAVALLDPSKTVPGTNWHAWMYLREMVQLALVAVSLWFGSQKLRDDNQFNYHAIVEVAALFSGIFIAMQPALQILHERGDELGIRTPAQFFWVTGSLSSALDNAPTYLVFFKTAQARPVPEGKTSVAGVEELTLIGISLGAVFMGAMTYIGNGPNFMVRAIAERSGVAMPSFFGYMVYSCLVLLPLFFLMMWLYLLFPY